MRDRTDLALGAIWEETVAFVRAELSLLLPVAMLGFGLPTVVMLLAVPMEATQVGMLKPGLWMLWFLPCGALSMLGSLAVSALALRPGVSVRESLGVAVSRMPSALGLFLLYVGLQLAMAVPLGLISVIELKLAGRIGPVSMIANLACIAVTIWLFVRLMPIWAVLSDRAQRPWEAVRAAFRLTRGCYPKLLLLRVVMVFASLLLMLVLLIPIGAIAQLIGTLAGGASVSILLSFIATGLMVAMIGGIWTVFVARLYRRLDASVNGSPINGM
ncbi:MAG: hypothetical protein ACTHOJ_07130 [Sphingomonas oligoaromativorans]|jgi:hypothetical protein